MKNLTIMILLLGLFSGCNSNAQDTTKTSIHQFSFTDINGNEVNMKDFEGKNIVIVNVASECGFTKQYEDLQKLHEAYKENTVVIGFPCNQFGGQEPGSEEEIETFCKKNFGVTFLLSSKVDVKGENVHPIYKWLTSKSENGVKDSSVKWNFQKYVINKQGELVDVFYSVTNPMSDKITKLLKD
jgi:glutathione peroxidase